MGRESGRWSGPDRLAVAVATFGGLGYAPVVPGTFGSLPALVLSWVLWPLGGSGALLAAVAFTSAVGVWSAGRASRLMGSRDPGRVVIDEVAGQLLTLSLVPPSPSALLAGFVLFRVLDIWKPYPANRLEELPGGSGIMADDLMAGLYGALCLKGATWILTGPLGGA